MAKDGIIVYNSRTGYTKRYAEYLAEELDFAIKPITKANLFKVSCYPVVIYGGGLHHNRIDGIEGLIEGFKYFGEQNLVVFSVGLASMNDDMIKQVIHKNFPDFLDGSFRFQPLPGGLMPEDCKAGSPVYDKINFYRQKRDEGKKLTRGDKIALSIADGETPGQNRFDTKACAPILVAARRGV